jgi:L-asparaginase
MSTPTILTIGTGGTISAVADARQRSGAGLSAAQIAASALGAEAGQVHLRSAEFTRIPGRAMRPTDMLALATLIQDSADECDGVIVTHGTDTLEETAFALATMLDIGKPIILTGAMRLPEDPGSDGPGNVRTALAAAADPATAQLGPLVAFHDELHYARWVAKTHTSKLAAFESPDGPRAGLVTEGRVWLSGVPRPGDHLGLPKSLADLRVELIWVAAGADGYLIEQAAQASDGLVVAGSGGGHTPPDLADAIGRVVKAGTPVVIASRCGAGPTLDGTYGGPGGEVHLRSIGALPAGRLHPLKARLRLLVALAMGLAPHKVFPA